MAKKPINSKKKGASYERTIAKLLSKWWGVELHRTPASGGLHWGLDNRVCGDIVAPVEAEFPFVTELKKREQWSFTQIIKGTGDFLAYWEQVNEDVARLEDPNIHPLLIFSKNHHPNFYAIEREVHEKLGLPLSHCFITKIKYKFRDEEREVEIAIGMLDDLIAIPKEQVIEALKN